MSFDNFTQLLNIGWLAVILVYAVRYILKQDEDSTFRFIVLLSLLDLLLKAYNFN